MGDSADDLSQFLQAKLGGKKLEFLAGHSLGGKVVLNLLQQARSNPPTQQVREYILISMSKLRRVDSPGHANCNCTDPFDLQALRKIMS